MASFGEDEYDRDLTGSQDGSSDNEGDVTMRDADEDNDNDNDNDNDLEPDPEQDADTSSNTDQVSEVHGLLSQPNYDASMISPTATNAAPVSISAFHPNVRPECVTARTYDIVPTTAAPHSTSINALTATADTRYVFSAGSDGYVRKFNWVDTMNSKLMLTVAQRHPFVDSVMKAGVLMTYWENMDGNLLSPVHSLASQSEGLWLLSGLESGRIRLQTTRHEEGKEIASLHQHTSAVSTLTLTPDEKTLLSGSWDKRILDWDLNTGQVRRSFEGGVGQISTVEMRPDSSIPVPRDTLEPQLTDGTYSSNNEVSGLGQFSFTDGTDNQGELGAATNPRAGSPVDSLFGGTDSLFGDADADNGGAGDGTGTSGALGMDGSFGQTLADGVAPEAGANDHPTHPTTVADSAAPSSNTNPDANTLSNDTSSTNAAPHETVLPNGVSSEPAVNGQPHADDLEPSSSQQNHSPSQPQQPTPTTSNETIFLAASIDGAIRIWDRRQPDPIARISSRNAPPWCMSACWSPDGNYIYAGRRNGTVEEFGLHKGLREPERIFKLPHGSGPVSSLKAMPNGRHLICASHDILRLYDLKRDQTSHRSTVPFLIVPGHRTGTISQLYIDQACRFMISASGNRGWDGNSTEVLLGYEIGVIE